MKHALIAALLSAGAAFAAASWVYQEDRSADRVAAGPAPAVVTFDPGLPAEARIAALERAVSDERQARQLLQEEVLFLTIELEDLRDRSAPGSDAGSEAGEVREARRSEESASARRERFARRNSAEGRIERLVEAGFAPSHASWIVQREQELQMEALEARFEAGRSGDPSDFYRSRVSASDALRDELGEGAYEQYLTATGRPTSVTISSVIGSSPAQTAGLQPGDEIVRYDGERIFSMTDLNLEAMDGEPGGNVVVDIERDGIPMQIVIPRGPLGITGGSRRR